MSKASTEALDALHGALAMELARRLREGTATAADLNVARQFLKDNGVEQPNLPGTPLRALTESLPFANEGANFSH